MGLTSDLRVLRSLLRGMPAAPTHAQRLDAFYAAQADDYDRFRERLLRGRAELMASLPLTPGCVLVELGGGTGRNLDFLGERIRDCAAVHLVDLCPSLLARARQRCTDRGWGHAVCHEADASTFTLAGGADAVVMAYSLTMIPSWQAAVANAMDLLRPGGHIAVVDFTVSHPTRRPGRAHHGPWTRWFWPRWFAHDGVHPDPRHLDVLRTHSEPIDLHEGRAPVPWLPFARVPFYRYLGRKA